MKRLFLFCFLSFIIASCGKDNFETTPQLKFKSMSGDVISANGGLQVVLEYTDKEGDVSDTLYMTKQRLNARTVATLRDTIELIMPEFPNTSKGDIELFLGYQNELVSAFDPPRIPGTDPPQYEPDTLSIKFTLKDKDGHKSDSVTIPTVVVLR